MAALITKSKSARLAIGVLACALALTSCTLRSVQLYEEPDAAAEDLEHAISRLPRNIILIMGDGMGSEQLATARYLREGPMRIDELRGPAWTNTDSLTTKQSNMPELNATDSAAAATTLATGVLAHNGVLSLTVEGKPLRTVLELSQLAGKATGFVTTSYFVDASPAAFTSHQPARDYFVDIAREILSETQPDVVMGAGAFVVDDPINELLPDVKKAGYFRVNTTAQLNAWNPRAHPRLLGLFGTDFVPAVTGSELFSMTPELERTAQTHDPRLVTMTLRALDRLSRDPDGFFLLAEDELFDMIGHRGPAETEWSNRAYGPQAVAFDETVGAVIDWVKEHSSFEDTLIVVTADHETGGYHFDHAKGPITGEFRAYDEIPSYRYGYHTRASVPTYARGPGSELLDHVKSHVDTHALLTGTLE